MEASTMNALYGGLIIGLSATLLFALAGRIAGISGIVTAAIKPGSDRAWRWLFIVGLLLGGFAYHYFPEHLLHSSPGKVIGSP